MTSEQGPGNDRARDPDRAGRKKQRYAPSAALRQARLDYAAGKSALPQVLACAEMARGANAETRGRVVLATVEGDTHRMGKALLAALLGASGFEVHDLGLAVPPEQVVDAVVRLEPDVVALSALLLTTSRQIPVVIEGLAGLRSKIPVLVGGAAMNRVEGAALGVLRGGGLYEGGVIYCRDVFEGLDVAEDLTVSDGDRRARRLASARAESVRATRLPVSPRQQPRLPASGGFASGPVAPPRPARWGIETHHAALEDVWQALDLNTLYRHHWGGFRLRGPAYGGLVRDVFDPALARLRQEAAQEGWLQATVVSGTFPCNADGDDLVLFAPRAEVAEVARLNFPRQPSGDRLCLADYFWSLDSGTRDVVVLQAVTVGPRVGERIDDLSRHGRYQEMLYVNGLAAATAEALAEYAHALARSNLAIPPGRGLRYSWGYLACPDLAQQELVLDLLEAETRIGLRLTSSLQLDPEHSTAAIVVHHPAATYFSVRQADPLAT